MNKDRAVRNFYVLPCCLLILNLAVGIVSYKTQVIHDRFLRVGAIILTVLFGASLVGFLLAPAVQGTVAYLHRRSRKSGGFLGEIVFLFLLGALVFWLYYRMYIYGPQSLLLSEWRN